MAEKSLNLNIYSILSLFLLSIIYFVENYGRSLISVSPIPYIDYSSYKYSLLSGTLFAIVYTLGGLFFSVNNNLNKYRVYSISFACFIFSLAIFSVALAENFWQQSLIRIIMGLAQSVVTPFSSGIISSHFPEKYRGIAFSIFNFGTYVSFSLALSLGTLIYDLYGWKAGYYLIGLFGILLAIITPFLVKDNVDIDNDNQIIDNSTKNQNQFEETNNTNLYIPPIIDNINPIHTNSNNNNNNNNNNNDNNNSNNNNKNYSIENDTSSKSCYSTFIDMIHTFERVLIVWKRNPALYMLCLATGIRLGAGYVWTSYTSVYYSELYISSTDESGDKNGDNCLYSYNQTYYDSILLTNPSQLKSIQNLQSTGIICDSSYPYCFPDSGECREINSLPWHNKGISHTKLQSFMSWIPLVGSGLGSMLGGHLSDILSRRQKGFWGFGRSGRPIVAGTSALLSIPFVLLALLAGYPGCFLYFIPSGLTGEMYLGASLALLSDVTPSNLIVPSVALFMFIVTLIGGNAPLLVPLILSISPITHYTFHFSAAPPYNPTSITTSNSNSWLGSELINYSIKRRSGYDLQTTLVILFTILYLLSTLVYYICAYLLWKTPNYETLEQYDETQDKDFGNNNSQNKSNSNLNHKK